MTTTSPRRSLGLRSSRPTTGSGAGVRARLGRRWVSAASAVLAATLAAAILTPASATAANPPASEAITELSAVVPTIDPPIEYDAYPPILDPGSAAADYFEPKWYDTDGRHIQAHGGQIVTVEEGGQSVHYWYGEDRSNDYWNSPGVGVYRSTDGMNWENLGTALRSISASTELEEPYFDALYDTVDDAGQPRADRIEELNYHLNTTQSADYTAIFERPKVLYNAANDQWVMWWHSDGRITPGGSTYARSMAAVAVADDPAGPFRMVGAYRLYNRANYQACTSSAVPGQARDMTVFQDDDGTAYIAYSSEENYTLYLARLNDDYTNVEKTTTTDTVNANQYSEDGQYPYIFADGSASAPVRGTDFQIVKECGHLEAPAIFKHGGRYYTIASGATGWAPNPQTYHTATDIFGTWIRGVEAGDQYETVSYNAIPEGGDGLLSVGDVRRTTFGSQSTNVFTLGPGKYAYMGDRWNSGAADSTYVWLPMTVGENGALQLRNPAAEDPARWGDGWDASYWDGSGLGAKIWSVTDPGIPSAVRWNADPDAVLPDQVAVTVDGATRQVAVTWEASFAELGTTVVTGRLAGDADFAPGRRFTRQILVWENGIANLAPSATVTASSRSDLARTVVDGNVKGKGWDDWRGGGTYPQNSWLAFDWATAQRPESVRVHTYRDGSQATWPTTVRVQYRSGGSWVDTDVVVILDPEAETAPVAELDVASLPATTGLRVQLQTNENVWQSISEVQIFGEAAAEGNLCRVAGSSVAASFWQTEWETMPAANACDGNTGTSWSTWASGGAGRDAVTFTVTAGTAYDVSQVTFTNTEGSPQSVSVAYRGTDGVWRDTTAQAVPVAAAGAPTVVDFAPVTALAVRLSFATTGTYLKIPEITVPATLAAGPAAGPEVETTVATRCVATKAYLTVRVRNLHDAPVDVTVASDFGGKTFAGLAPGKAASVSLNTRTGLLAAGAVDVAASDGSATAEESTEYATADCR